MRTTDAARAIVALLEEGRRRGAPAPSEELRAFLAELSASPGLRKPVNRRRTPGTGISIRTASRVGARTERATEADMAKTIDEMAQKLRGAFDSEERFETVLADPKTKKLSKAGVVTLYNSVFESPRPLARSMTKPEIFNAIRRERINRVRGRS